MFKKRNSMKILRIINFHNLRIKMINKKNNYNWTTKQNSLLRNKLNRLRMKVFKKFKMINFKLNMKYPKEIFNSNNNNKI